MGMSQGRRYIKNAELLKFTLSFVVGKSRPQLSKELIGLQDKDLEFRKNMHPTREMTSNLIVLNVKYYQGSKGSCPRLDTRLNASNLGEDTTESLTKPSTTDNLLFERSRFDKYGSLQNEVVKIQTSHNEKIGALSKICRRHREGSEAVAAVGRRRTGSLPAILAVSAAWHLLALAPASYARDEAHAVVRGGLHRCAPLACEPFPRRPLLRVIPLGMLCELPIPFPTIGRTLRSPTTGLSR
uniref:Uncharacterized protein n=1 Tax=Oryza nivara TaxID=4536 RepID=A0A0E0FGM6_ORYNI